MILVVVVHLLGTAFATTQVLDMSLTGLEAAPDNLCSRGLRVANFCGNKLRSAPPCCSSFRRLYLYRNRIEDLPADWLADCSHLEELSVSHNALRRLPDRLLESASSLRRLQASRNNVHTLPPGLLRNAASLQELDLSHNALENLPHAFLEKNSHLVELFLQANALRNVSEDLLANCGSLQVLWLSNNHLVRLPKLLLSATPHLRTARFEHNLIEDIAGGAFDNNPQLRFVDLSSNHLTSLPSGLFGKTTLLQRLLLADNRLSVVPPPDSLPQRAAVIDLSYNLMRTIEDFSVFGTSRVMLDHNMWCHDLIPASELSKFDKRERHRWFAQRPVRYDRPTGRVEFTAMGLLKCGASTAAPRGHATHAADATVNLTTTDTAPTVTINDETVNEAPSISQRNTPTTDTVGSEDQRNGTARVTLSLKYTTPVSTIIGMNTALGDDVEAISNESVADGKGSTETIAVNYEGSTQSETTTSGYSELGMLTAPNEHNDTESIKNSSPESTSTTETSTEATY